MPDPSVFEAAFERAPLGLQILELVEPGDAGSFTAIAVNQAACEITGQDMKADVGRTWRETSPGLVESEFADLFLGCLERQEPVTWLVRYGDSRFSERWWRGTANALSDNRLVLLFQDATREQEVQLELERSNAALDEFAYVASHDLRAPLRDIRNLTSWLVEDLRNGLPEPSATHLVTVEQRAHRMEEFLDDLLEYSRAGRVDVPPESFDLAEAVERALALASRPPGFDIVVRVPSLTLTTPRTPLETVLRNLVDNAVKHHDRSDGRIEIVVHVNSDAVEFCVSDDGPGIDPTFHDRIFQVFQRLQTRDEVEGSGLGLALCRRLVAAQGGELSVDSAPGEGARFIFTWPRDATG